jgi:hypothetical protein
MTLELYHVAILKWSYCMLNEIKHSNMHGIIRMYLDATDARHVRRRRGVKQNTSVQIYAYMYQVPSNKVHVHCTRHTRSSEYNQNQQQSETTFLANGIDRTEQAFVRSNWRHDPSQHYSYDIRNRIMTKTTALLPPFIEKVSDLCCVKFVCCLYMNSTFRFLTMFVYTGFYSNVMTTSWLICHTDYYKYRLCSLAGLFFILLLFFAARGLVGCWLRPGDHDEAGAGDRHRRQESFLSSHCAIVKLKPMGLNLLDSFKAGKLLLSPSEKVGSVWQDHRTFNVGSWRVLGLIPSWQRLDVQMFWLIRKFSSLMNRWKVKGISDVATRSVQVKHGTWYIEYSTSSSYSGTLVGTRLLGVVVVLEHKWEGHAVCMIQGLRWFTVRSHCRVSRSQELKKAMRCWDGSFCSQKV